ncbi:MAG TPA: DDE transposase family protein [Crinalium sp.]|jgi:hypothetical protein
MSEGWYIVKQEDGHCEILSAVQIQLKSNKSGMDSSEMEKWGPFVSEAEAIARRVGLIRSGKCQPL